MHYRKFARFFILVLLLMLPLSSATAMETVTITQDAFNTAAQNWDVNGVESVQVELQEGQILVMVTLVNEMTLDITAIPTIEETVLGWNFLNGWPVADPPERAQQVADMLQNRTQQTFMRLTASMLGGVNVQRLRWNDITLKRGVIDVTVDTGRDSDDGSMDQGMALDEVPDSVAITQDDLNQMVQRMDLPESISSLQLMLGVNGITAQIDGWKVALSPPADGSEWTAEVVSGDVPPQVLERLPVLVGEGLERMAQRKAGARLAVESFVIADGSLIAYLGSETGTSGSDEPRLITRIFEISAEQLNRVAQGWQLTNVVVSKIETDEGKLLVVTNLGTVILTPSPDLRDHSWFAEVSEGDVTPELAQQLADQMEASITRVFAQRFGEEAGEAVVEAASIGVGITVWGITLEVTVSDDDVDVGIGFEEDESSEDGGDDSGAGAGEGDDGGDGEGGEIEP